MASLDLTNNPVRGRGKTASQTRLTKETGGSSEGNRLAGKWAPSPLCLIAARNDVTANLGGTPLRTESQMRPTKNHGAVCVNPLRVPFLRLFYSLVLSAESLIGALHRDEFARRTASVSKTVAPPRDRRQATRRATSVRTPLVRCLLRSPEFYILPPDTCISSCFFLSFFPLSLLPNTLTR